MPTGRNLHHYINPERNMPQGAFEVHGLSTKFLSGYPVFAALADEIVAFLGDAVLVIHNAAFDMKFINAELRRLARPEIPMAQALDTVQLARRKYPGAQVSLDALCRRFEIDNGHRTLHGALLDADLLAAVYLELIGGRQPDLALSAEPTTEAAAAQRAVERAARRYREPRPHAPTAEELSAHRTFLESIKEPVWLAGSSA